MKKTNFTRKPKIIITSNDVLLFDDVKENFNFKKQHIDWWQSLEASQRFHLMKRYSIRSVSDKLIKRMWKGENNEQ